MTNFNDVERYGAVSILGHGFVLLVDVMGSDSDICKAARCSFGRGLKNDESNDKNLIRYLYRNEHHSPFEMAEVKFFIKIPIHIARQYVRHRTQSINEYSGRYSEMSDKFYIPPLAEFKKQSNFNKQLGGDVLDEEIASELQDMMFVGSREAYDRYKKTLELGLSKEVARLHLPVSNYTELYTKMNLRNFFHLIRLRDDPKHAQGEIVTLARAMYSFIKPLFPLACEAFEDYEKNAISLSKQEQDILRQLLSVVDHSKELENIALFANLTKKEQEEFKQKLNGV